MPDIFVSSGKDKQKFISPEKENGTILPKEEPRTEAQKIAIPGHTHNKLSAFSLYPDDVDFETKESKEKIILLLRRHPSVNFKWFLVLILMIFAPIVGSAFNIFSFLPSGFELVISLTWYLVTTTYALENFLSWYFDIYLITDNRVIDIDFYNLVYKRVSDASISKIQDVSYTTSGVAGNLFDYGDVTIQTAAELSDFHFESVPNPEKVSKIINDLKKDFKVESV